MTVLFLPAAAMLIAMFILAMAPIFHFAPSQDGNTLPSGTAAMANDRDGQMFEQAA